MKKYSEKDIIESVKRGNQSDFSLLIDIYKNKAFSMLKRMLKNQMDAEEALQDSFLKAYENLATFRGDSKFSTWFYRIVYNTALTRLASAKRKIEKEMSSIDDHYDLYENDDKIYSESKDAKTYLFNVIEELPVRNAVVLILFYIDDMSLNEISQVMDVSLVNAKVLLHRSRNLLRDLLLKHNYQEEMI